MAGAFASFAAFEAHLERLGLFRIRPELGCLRTVLATLGASSGAAHLSPCPSGLPAPWDGIWPDKPPFAVQIVGTNGKGSTSTFLASLARHAGNLRVGLYTSPHFLSFRERIRINGTPVSEDALLAAANRAMAAGGENLTYFELVTVVASLVFTAQTVDIAVMETGLGGSWDAVTALPVDAVAFTPIGLDHCGILGDTVEAVARDKAGAIRPGKPVFSAPQHPDAAREIERAAKAHAAPLTLAGNGPDGPGELPDATRSGGIPLGLAGEHQQSNAALALAVWRHAVSCYGWETPAPQGSVEVPTTEAHALHAAFIPGRLQFVPASPEHGHPALLLDGAHNAHGMAALGKALAQQGIAPAAIIFSCLADKDPALLAPNLRALSTGPIFVPPIPDNPRAAEPETIANAIGLAATPVRNMQEALTRASEHIAAYMPDQVAAHPRRHPVLICGSLYMLASFYSLRPDCLNPSAGE